MGASKTRQRRLHAAVVCAPARCAHGEVRQAPAQSLLADRDRVAQAHRCLCSHTDTHARLCTGAEAGRPLRSAPAVGRRRAGLSGRKGFWRASAAPQSVKRRTCPFPAAVAALRESRSTTALAVASPRFRRAAASLLPGGPGAPPTPRAPAPPPSAQLPSSRSPAARALLACRACHHDAARPAPAHCLSICLHTRSRCAGLRRPSLWSTWVQCLGGQSSRPHQSTSSSTRPPGRRSWTWRARSRRSSNIAVGEPAGQLPCGALGDRHAGQLGCEPREAASLPVASSSREHSGCARSRLHLGLASVDGSARGAGGLVPGRRRLPARRRG